MDDTLKALDSVIAALCWVEGPPVPAESLVREALFYHWNQKGSRLRPRLAARAATALGFPQQQALRMAAVCELLHNASLIHDDVLDRADFRRGQPSLWQHAGVPIAIASGDLLISAAYAALAELDADSQIPSLIQVTHQMILRTIHGQLAPLASGQSDLKTYEALARAKTGALFALPLMLPLVALGQIPESEIARQAGEAFGVAYQIFDDMLDEAEDMGSVEEGVSMNLLRLLAVLPDVTDPRQRAREMAIRALGTARSLAEGLPVKVTAVFFEEVERLERQLTETHA